MPPLRFPTTAVLGLTLGLIVAFRALAQSPAQPHRVLLPDVVRDEPEVQTTIVEGFESSASGWPNSAGTFVTLRHVGGEFQVLLRSGAFAGGATSGVAMPWRRFRAEVDARLEDAHQQRAVGLAFGIPDAAWTRYYACLVGDGAAGFWRGGPGFLNPLATPAASGAVRPAGAVNRVRIDAGGTSAQCYVNGEPAASATGLTSVEGQIGVVARTAPDVVGADARFDNYAVVGVPVIWTATPTVTPVPTRTPTPSPTITQTPSGAAWTARSPMSQARRGFGLAASDAGSLYAVGGSSSVGLTTVPTLEEYDPTADRWSTLAPPAVPRFGLGVAFLGGKLYAVGGTSGTGSGSRYEATLEEYDPAIDRWSTRRAMPTARTLVGVAALDGRLYAVGGTDGSRTLGTAEAYDPASDTWETRASLQMPRYAFALVAAAGRLYAIGGPVSEQSSVEEYDPATDTWRYRAPLPTAAMALAATAYQDRIYAVGGNVRRTGWPGDPVHRYDPALDAWTELTRMPRAREHHGTAAVGGKLYVAGGYYYAGIAWLEEVLTSLDEGTLSDD